MKKLVVLMLAMLVAGSAMAQPIDPDPNMLGLYLDEAATMISGPAPVAPFNIYVVLTNPTVPEVKGVEFGWDVVSGVLYLNGAVTFPVDAVNLGATDSVSGEVAAGYSAAMPTSTATVMATIPCFHFGGACDIVLRNNSVSPSGSNPLMPCILDGAGDVMMVGLSADVGNVALAIGTSTQVVATEEATLDQVKSLYR